MKKLLMITAVLLILCACSQKQNNNRIEQQIHFVENNLIEFKSPANMFRPDSAQLASPYYIIERMKYYSTPGVSIAVINNNQLAWTKAYGIKDANTNEPVTTNTIFEAASTSKFLTAALALHFVQNGLIDLDENVNSYLTSWQIPENEFTTEKKVTLRFLLTHQAGLPTTNFNYDENIGYPTLLNVLNGESPALNEPAIPILVPGSQWQYSNVAYDVIQLLLEDISGKSFQQIADEIIFKPLGMVNSTFNYPLDSSNKNREAMPHDAKGISQLPRMHLTAVAHGGLTTTPSDLAKFTNEIMLSYNGKSEKILSQSITRTLFQSEKELDPNMFGIPLSEGLGVFLMGDGKDFLFMHPGGNLPGLNCWLIGWPNRSNAVIVMSNGAKGEMLAMEIISAINLLLNNN